MGAYPLPPHLIMTMKQINYSKNKRAEKLVGLRDAKRGMVVLDFPGELGYRCPVCKNEVVSKELGMYDERLEWSEYNGFLWCSVCNRDYPSALCQPDIEKAIIIYLDCIEDAIKRKQKKIKEDL